MPKQMREKKVKTGVVGVRIDVATIQQIDQRARAAGLRRNDVVKELITRGISQQSNKAPAIAGVLVG